ncbi:MAG: hypothetical protein IJK87_08505 [Prevotella sp.]|nr:hypothetical protein [Prevotella sp.]
MPIGTAKWLVEQHTDGTHAVRYVTGNCYRLPKGRLSLAPSFPPAMQKHPRAFLHGRLPLLNA